MHIAHTLNQPHIQKKAFFILVSIAFFVLCMYVYFVNQTVWNVVSRQNAVKTIHKVSSEVAVLEASYMKLSSALTLEHAYILGFQEVKSADTLFVERLVPAVAVR